MSNNFGVPCRSNSLWDKNCFIYFYLLGLALLVEDCVDGFQSAYAQSYKCIFCRYHRLRCDEQEDDLHFDRVMYIFLVAPEKYNQK